MYFVPVPYVQYSVLAPYTQVPQNKSVLRTPYFVPSMHSHTKRGRANVNQGRVTATPRRKIDRSVERHVLASSPSALCKRTWDEAEFSFEREKQKESERKKARYGIFSRTLCVRGVSKHCRAPSTWYGVHAHTVLLYGVLVLTYSTEVPPYCAKKR